MSLEFGVSSLEFCLPLCIRWDFQVPRPTENRRTVSSSFRMRNIQWRFKCAECIQLCRNVSDETCNIELSLENQQFADQDIFCPPLDPLTVSAHVISSGGQALEVAPLEMRPWRIPLARIWSCAVSEVERLLPAFQLDRRLTFQIAIGMGTAFQQCPHFGMHARTFTSASVQTCLPDDNALCQESLSQDFCKFLDEYSDSADVEFQFPDGDFVKAHRSVVCARSPVLAAMLRSNMLEGRTGEVGIEDIQQDIFRQLLKYMYSGILENLTVDSAIRLYEAGDRYAVDSLTRRCSRYLVDNLSVQNACEFLVVADAHSDSDLVERVVHFMWDKRIPDQLGDLWQEFCGSHPTLANRVLNRFYKLFSRATSDGECSASKRRRECD